MGDVGCIPLVWGFPVLGCEATFDVQSVTNILPKWALCAGAWLIEEMCAGDSESETALCAVPHSSVHSSENRCRSHPSDTPRAPRPCVLWALAAQAPLAAATKLLSKVVFLIGS